MTHSRVTKEGQALGQLAAHYAKRGRQRLETEGLVDLKLTMLRDEMCKTCACQLGTVPNGCLQTQLDFLKTVVEGKPFLCHAPHDGRMCAGWAGARAEHVANPLPQVIQKALSEWEYSPPDEESPNVGVQARP